MEAVVSCTRCGAKNRLRTPPPGQLPVCGSCGTKLPWLLNGSDDSFASELNAPVPVLVDFWAPWCGPCRMIAPVLEELARELSGKLKIVKLNVDEQPRTAAEYQVQGIPMLLLFKNGKVADKIVGAMPKSALLERLRPQL